MSTKVTGILSEFSGQIVEIPFNEKTGVKVGDAVIFRDADECEEYGLVKFVNRDTTDKEKVLFSSAILRLASPHDLQKVETHNENVEQTLRSSKKLASKYDLDMQVFRASYSYDGKKLHVTFTAEDRVDFRDLVKEMASLFKKQIYLRQVGPRDRAKMLGGHGRCGRVRCSTAFLKDLESINMDMVRVQGLESRGSSKLSGVCGKLLCCLKFEIDTYKELRKKMPKIGDAIKVKKTVSENFQEGWITGLDILNQKARVELANRTNMIVEGRDIEKVKKGDVWENFEYKEEKDQTAISKAVKVDEDSVETFMDDESKKLVKQ
ncbi:MAG: regulatory iron-sulfur-containing complex subunit RicT [Candidatus Gracilibacteria bacterium]